MAYSTELQRVVQYLKAGGKIAPPKGTAVPSAPTATPLALPNLNAPSEPAKAAVKPSKTGKASGRP